MAQEELAALQAKLVKSPAARAKFLSSVFTLLEDNGVAVTEDLAARLDLNLDLRDGKNWTDGVLASTNIVTINH